MASYAVQCSQVRIVAILGTAIAACAALLLAASGAARGVSDGGTFRVAITAGRFTTIDPALVSGPFEINPLRPACGSLIAYPDKPLPEGRRLRPDLAEAEPVMSRDGRSFTFTIRRNARFSDGSPVTARAFARAIERSVDPAMHSSWELDSTHVKGVVARGRTLIVKLRKRVPGFLAAMSGLCAVPPNLPADPEGAKAPLASPAPYYVAEYVPNEQLVLEHNVFYRGSRPQHVSRFVVDVGADEGSIIDQIASGTFDYGWPVQAWAERGAELQRRYGLNKSQFFVKPDDFVRMFVLNTSRPLFRNNAKLRQAVNFAVDRRALTRELGPFAGIPTDQYLVPSMPGYRNARIYPLDGPDLGRARTLARGRTRGGKAVLYTRTDPRDLAQAQVLQQNLKAIGLDLTIVSVPAPLGVEKLATGQKEFDIGRIAWSFTDPSLMLDTLFNGRTIGKPENINFSYFDSPEYNRLLDQASRLTGDEGYRAYGELDVQLARDAAPAIPVAVLNAITFVSARVGCIVLNPFLDLTAVCLK